MKDKPLKNLIKIEAEKESKKRAGEMNEVIETLGQESTSKALPFVQEKIREQDQEKEDSQNKKLNFLDGKAKFAKKDLLNDPYRKALCNLIIARVKESKWPKGYHFKALPTDEGVVLLLMTPKQKIYGQGFKPVHLTEYDLNACEVLVMQAENRVDKLETPEGIILGSN